MSAVEVIVSPPIRSVHVGQDAAFTCHAKNIHPDQVQFQWEIPPAILNSGRVDNNYSEVRILDTIAADNNTDVTCLVFNREGSKFEGSSVAELVVLPPLPTTERPTTTQSPEGATTKADITTKLTERAETTLPTTFEASTTNLPATPTPALTSKPSTPIPPTTHEGTTSSAWTRVPSKMPNGPHQGPTQSAVGGLQVGTIVPAVVGGLVVFVCLLVVGAILMRRHRRKSRDADLEKAKHSETHMYVFIPPGSMDFQDGGNSDEENHNFKRHGNNHTNQDSLRTYSRGTAPDSITRYARAVPRKDRIVHGGGHGGKPRPEPVLTISMNSLYEETTPTFVVANPENGTVDVLPYKAKGEAVEIVGSLQETRLAHSDDEDEYVTLAQNPPQPQNK